MNALNEILELSPPVALLLALIMLGFFLKRSPYPAWAIPLTLGVLSAVAYPFIADLSKVSFQVSNPTVFNGILGLLIGLASSGLQAQFRHILERFLPANGKDSGDTPAAEPPKENQP